MSRKIKHTTKFKQKIVAEVEKGNRTLSSLTSEYSLSQGMVKFWRSLHNKHGTKGLAQTNRKYTANYKAKVIRYMLDNSLSLTQTCVHFNIHSRSTVVKWISTYNKEGIAGLSKETRGRIINMSRKAKKNLTKEEQLLEELADLKAENAYLKKLHALVQLEKKKEQKRKSSGN
jgi:transposase